MNEPCPKTIALSARLDDELAPRERARLDAHVAGCPVCAATLADLGRLSEQLRNLPEETLGYDLAEVLRARLEGAPVPRAVRHRAPRRFGWLPLGAGAAASLALGLALGLAATAGAGVAVAPQVAAMSVFAPVAPGGLCIEPRTCTWQRSTSWGSSR